MIRRKASPVARGEQQSWRLLTAQQGGDSKVATAHLLPTFEGASLVPVPEQIGPELHVAAFGPAHGDEGADVEPDVHLRIIAQSIPVPDGGANYEVSGVDPVTVSPPAFLQLSRPGGTWKYVAKRTGAFGYSCSYHPTMTATFKNRCPRALDVADVGVAAVAATAGVLSAFAGAAADAFVHIVRLKHHFLARPE